MKTVEGKKVQIDGGGVRKKYLNGQARPGLSMAVASTGGIWAYVGTLYFTLGANSQLSGIQ